ncbi:MAG: MaoC family dehydratase N-terminal domain-containing protein [Chloroflexi bacterium]|nr:MaoC family dehydratase N-terminal domain-containing protein [Chloroflexota bacterium]
MPMEMRYPTLTDEDLEACRKVVGVELRNSSRISEATKDTILMFARAIGSRNPVFQEETYADKTFWGCLVAHPTFLYAVDNTIVAPGLPGIHTIYGGTDWEFFHPVRVGDSLYATRRLMDLQRKEGRFCGLMALQVGEVSYQNQHGYLVARATSHVLRTPRDAARDKGKYAHLGRYQYEREDFLGIMTDYDKEEIRGDRPRYWEETLDGEQLPPIVRGPLSTEDMNHFVRTTIRMPMMAYFADHLRRHPADAYWDPALGMPDSWYASLLKDSVAREFGFPAAHDTGYQRICWLENLITNWMGDLAFLKKLSVRLVGPNLHGDTTWCKGRVVSKHREGQDYLVTLEVWCENQRGDITASGSATVATVSRDPKSLPPLVDVPPRAE